MRITNDFLDMFLAQAGDGKHEFQFLFGDGRKEMVTTVDRSTLRWPHTVMDQNFLVTFRMVAEWVETSGRIAFLTVKSVGVHEHGYAVEEVRCWSLTPLGAIPYSRREAADKHGLQHTVSVWDIEADREQRYCDAWDRDIVLG